jgi:hypothetical protein
MKTYSTVSNAPVELGISGHLEAGSGIMDYGLGNIQGFDMRV